MNTNRRHRRVRGAGTPDGNEGRPRTPGTVLAALMAVALLAVGAVSHLAGSPAAQAAPGAQQAPAQVDTSEVDHRHTRLDLALVSRTYDAGDDNWTIVAEATLDSNRICLPVVFNCIVGQDDTPTDATLVDLTCDSSGWNHLVVFREHCMKQLLFAGHDQKFTFTWRTDPGVNSGTVDLSVEFGRGILPHTFQQLATAGLTVDLGTTLDVTKSCPTTVDAGSQLNCTITVTHPVGPTAGPTLSGISVTDTPDSALGAFLSGGALTKSAGAGTWSCASATCTDGELAAGESAEFDFAATVATDPTGGTGTNEASVQWTTPVAGGPVTASGGVTVVGTGDTELTIEKATAETGVDPGATVTWTVVVTNEGPLAATDVVINDVAPTEVNDLELTYVEGVGEWSCTSTSCTTSSMPEGTTTFSATGTVATDAAADTSIVNEVGVSWENNILGPDFPVTAGSAVPVVAAATTTVPGSTTIPGGGGAPLSYAG